MERFFATCPRGLELLLADELRQLKAEKVHARWRRCPVLSAIFFFATGSISKAASPAVFFGRWRSGSYRSEDDIYRTAYALRWTDWFDPARTIRVDVSATKSPLTSLNFVTLKIKDAVCDKIRRISGRRPSVDTREPDIPIQAHLTDREFTLYLDTTGEPLFKRGQRIGHRRGAAQGKSRRGNSSPRRMDARYSAARSHVRQRHDPARSGAHGARYRARPGTPFCFREIQKLRRAPLARAVATKRRRGKSPRRR